MKKIIFSAAVVLSALSVFPVTSLASSVSGTGDSGESEVTGLVEKGSANGDPNGASLAITKVPDFDFGTLKLGDKFVTIAGKEIKGLKTTSTGTLTVKDVRGVEEPYTVTGEYEHEKSQIKIEFPDKSTQLEQSEKGTAAGNFEEDFTVTGNADFSDVSKAQTYKGTIKWTLLPGKVNP